MFVQAFTEKNWWNRNLRKKKVIAIFEDYKPKW